MYRIPITRLNFQSNLFKSTSHSISNNGFYKSGYNPIHINGSILNQYRCIFGNREEYVPDVPADYKPRIKDFGEVRPLNPYNHLKIYCFPGMGGHIVFHPRILTSVTQRERLYKSAVFLSRKWRYLISDIIASFFVPLAISNSVTKRKIYRFLTSLIHRECEAEYLFSKIPKRTSHIEFIYPKGYITEGQDRIQDHLRDLFNKASENKSLVPITLLLLSSLGLLTFLRHIAPILYIPTVYLTSRVSGRVKCEEGRKRYLKCIGNKTIVFTESEPLKELLEDTSSKVHEELLKENKNKLGMVWSLKPNSDIHDRVIKSIENELRLYELNRTYTRCRRDVILKGYSPFQKV